MSKPARGTKRVCPSCGARFYDLSRSPITCPVCQAAYQVTPPTSRRSERAAPVEVKKPVAPEADPPAAAETEVEVISLDEAGEAEEAAVGEEDIVVLDDDDEDDLPATDDDDDTFLEEDEDADADVTDIVGGAKKEES